MRLRHENIVRLEDVVVGQRMHKIFLVMEYCEMVMLPCSLPPDSLGSREWLRNPKKYLHLK